MASNKRCAPRPSRQGSRSRPEGKATKWLGWYKTYDAVNDFQQAARSAAIKLAEFPIAQPIGHWLISEAIAGTDEYIEQLAACSDDIDSAVTVTNDFRDEEEYICGLISHLKDLADDFILKSEEEISVGERDDLIDLVIECVEDVCEKGWDMYHVFIRAA